MKLKEKNKLQNLVQASTLFLLAFFIVFITPYSMAGPVDENDKSFMRLAIEKAKEGIKEGGSPFGACIVKDGKVVTCVHNVVWQTTDSTAHAEINAIRMACKKLNTIDLSGCTIFSTTEPCPMCFSACHWAMISRIIFGARIEDAKKAGFNELTISNGVMKKLGKSPIEVIGGFLRNENQKLFKIWLGSNKMMAY